MKQLIDSTASLWLKGEMEGKPAGVFTSTASTHGGQETTLVTMMIPLLHIGMLIIGVPYSVKGMLHTEARGGAPYGARQLRGNRANCSQLLRISTLLGHGPPSCRYRSKGPWLISSQVMNSVRQAAGNRRGRVLPLLSGGGLRDGCLVADGRRIHAMAGTPAILKRRARLYGR